jgi:hypothetical protein
MRRLNKIPKRFPERSVTISGVEALSDEFITVSLLDGQASCIEHTRALHKGAKSCYGLADDQVLHLIREEVIFQLSWHTRSL